MRTCLLLAMMCLLVDAPDRGAAPPTAPTASPGPTEELAVQYARAQLHLAEANLKRVQQMNARVKRAVPDSVVADLEHDTEVARLELEQAEKPQASEFTVWLRRAEMAWKSTESNWRRGVAANQRSAVFDPQDIERFRLRAEVARLQFARGQALVKASRDDQLQWELDVLHDEVQRVKQDATRVAPFVRLNPFWW
jgi:hypothetical protein